MRAFKNQFYIMVGYFLVDDNALQLPNMLCNMCANLGIHVTYTKHLSGWPRVGGLEMSLTQVNDKWRRWLTSIKATLLSVLGIP